MSDIELQAETPGEKIMRLFTAEIIRRLEHEASEMKAADFELVRKLLADNSVTLASVRRGKFGDFAQTVADELPFEDDGTPRFVN